MKHSALHYPYLRTLPLSDDTYSLHNQALVKYKVLNVPTVSDITEYTCSNRQVFTLVSSSPIFISFFFRPSGMQDKGLYNLTLISN